MDDFFDVIYCINLKRCHDRREHMIEQFKKIGIDKYQFIEGVDKNDPLVKKTMVYQHVNKKLSPSQIGNWLSYRKIWKDMVANKYQLALICEDDLFFMNYTSKVINSVFSNAGRKKYGLRLDQPSLIRLGWLKSSDHQFQGQVRLNKKVKMSNPCHAINLGMAKKLDAHLQKIDTTSDIYIHSRIGPRYNHHTVFPPIAYELSYNKEPKFRSEISPKPRFINKLLKDFRNVVEKEAKTALAKLIQKEIQLLPSRKRLEFRGQLPALVAKTPAPKTTAPKTKSPKVTSPKIKTTVSKKKSKKRLFKIPPLYGKRK